MTTHVYVDGQEIAALSGEQATLSAAFDAARAIAGERLLVEIRVDGRELDQDELDRAMLPAALSSPPGSADQTALVPRRIDIMTADADELRRAVLVDAADALESICPLHNETAELIFQGRTDEALLALGQLLGTWSSVRGALEAGAAVPEGNAADDESSRRELNSAVNGLADRLSEIKRALATPGGADWSALADVLQYDMNSQAEQCRRWLLRASAAVGASG